MSNLCMLMCTKRFCCDKGLIENIFIFSQPTKVVKNDTHFYSFAYLVFLAHLSLPEGSQVSL